VVPPSLAEPLLRLVSNEPDEPALRLVSPEPDEPALRLGSPDPVEPAPPEPPGRDQLSLF
jgi:hypothetical protein